MKETFIAIELSDIKGVAFDCASCQGRVILSADKVEERPRCPLCRKSWQCSYGLAEKITEMLSVARATCSVNPSDVIIRLVVDESAVGGDESDVEQG